MIKSLFKIITIFFYIVTFFITIKLIPCPIVISVMQENMI